MTNAYSPFGSVFVDPNALARLTDPALPTTPAPRVPAPPPTAAPDLRWDTVKAQRGWDTATPEDRQRIHADYANVILPWLAQQNGGDPAQWTQQFLRDVPVPSDDGDLVRGFKSYWPGTKAALYGLGALGADLVGAEETAGTWATQAQALLNQQAQDGRASDSLSTAWTGGQGIGGTLGNLADWAQFNLGQMVPSVLESLVFSIAGAAAGSGAAPGPGTAGGALAGLFGKTLVRKEVEAQIADMAAKYVAKRVGEGAAESLAKREALALMQTQLKRETLRTLGETGALATASTARGLGESYNTAYATEQAGGPAVDLGRVLAGGAIYGAAETFGDAMLADTLLRGVRGDALKDRVVAGFARNALSEGATEAVQEAATRFAGQQSLTDVDAWTAYLDSAAAGGIGGGVFGAVGAIRERPHAQGDAAFLDAMGTMAQDRGVSSPPYSPLRALPAPVVQVNPAGVATTPGDRDAALRADAAWVRERAALGLTPDVNAARGQHPAARPNAAVDRAAARPQSAPAPVAATPAAPAAASMEDAPTATAAPAADIAMPATPAAPGSPAAPPRGVALNTTTPEGEALMGFREQRGNTKVRVRRSDWESDRSYLPLFDASGRPIAGATLHRALLADARIPPTTEAPASADTPAGADAGGQDSGRGDPGAGEEGMPSSPLDRSALQAVFLGAMEKKFPNVTERERASYRQSTDDLIDAIERRDVRALLGRNLGDAKANSASRAVFAAATGVMLPRGRRATEDALFAWAGTDRATEVARTAQHQAQREADARAPVETFPTFASYAEANRWVERRSRAFGGKQAYRATEEYGRLQPTLRRLADAMNDGNRTRRLSVLAAAGLAIGDRVEATARGALYAPAQTVQGTLFARSGFPWVRLDEGQTITVSHDGRIESRREVPWSEQWKKIPPAALVAEDDGQTHHDAPASAEALADESTSPRASARSNARILMQFVDALVAQVRSGQSGRVAFPVDFEHVTEVESAVRAVRRAFERAGAVNSGGRSGARYAIEGGIVTLSNSSNQLWANIEVATRDAAADTALPERASAVDNGASDTDASAHASPATTRVAPQETSTDDGTVQTQGLSARDPRGADAPLADRAGDRQPLAAGLARTGAAADRGRLLPRSAGEPDGGRGAGEDGHLAEPPVELGEGAGVGAVAGTADLERRGRTRPRRERRGRVRDNEEAAAIDDPAASSVVAPEASPQASSAPATNDAAEPSPDEGLAEDLGKGGLARKARDNLAAIRIVQALEAEGRDATPEERRQLARYVGWGALKAVFDPGNAQWAKVREELQGLLTEAQWRAARASVLNAHYTSKTVIDGMFAGLTRLGVTRGRILEPAVGIGHFFGGMPAKLRNASTLFGVELDPLTQRIAATLYPKATIRQSGFQDIAVPGEFFDVVIGNPPFGSEPIVDAERSSYSGFSIHNYFFAKAIDKLRPGGLLMMVVSHNFLDTKDSRARQWIAERADLVAAARLPRTAFAENAGTEVVTDIVVLQKRAADTPVETEEAVRDRLRWVQTGEQRIEHPATGESLVFAVNPYFLDRPDHVLGTPAASGSMYRANEYTVEPSGELAKQLQAWAQALPEGVYVPIDRTEAATRAEVPEGTKVGAYFIGQDGRIFIRDADRLGEPQAQPWTAPGATAEARMRGMIELREVLRLQMRLERSADATEAQIEANRRTLNDRYDAFLKRYGHLSASRTNRSLFFDDPDASLLLALEFDYDAGLSEAVAKRENLAPRAPKAEKADIFRRRVLFPPSDFVHVGSARDALVASLNYRGRLDPDYMTQVYGKDRAAIVAELGAMVFETPDGALVTADDYLSGDVKTKLAEAKDAARRDSRFARNVDALTKVIPRDKTPSEIAIAFGAPFLPVDDLRDFHREITGADAHMVYLRGVGQWLVSVVGRPDPVRNAATWGTKEMGATEILQATLAGRAVVVTRTIKRGDGKTETIVLEAETERAREKQTALRAEWRAWVWRDPERAERLLGLYNEKMNRSVERRYDGSHLTLPGMSPALTLLRHQQNGVWRGLQSRQLLLDHVVGAGKTFQMVAIAMEMRRLGIARKPLFAVPNHLTVQWRTEFARMYPGAVVLAAEPDDFTRENRKKLFSRIVTGDWDAIIVGHSSLKKIGLPEETETRILREQVDEIASLIEQIKRDRGDRGIVREMEGIRARLEAKVKDKQAKIGARDNVLTFDELGVDALFVDELHEFKNLFYTTTMSRVPGMGNPNGSDRAFDLFVKTQWLFETFGDNAPIVTATGTPVSNSLVEMFNLQRFMQYPRLRRQDLHVFDAWARQYGSIENVYEVAPSGTGFRASTRFVKFQNLPALMADYRAFADVVTLDDLKAQEAAKGKRFPVPNLHGGRPQIVIAERSPQVAEFMGVPHLARGAQGEVVFGFNPGAGERAKIEPTDTGRVQLKIEGGPNPRFHSGYQSREEAEMAAVELALTPQIAIDNDSVLGKFGRLRELTRATKGKVNALSLTGQANKAGLDYRLIDPTAPDFPGSKLNLALERMLALYRQWEADKGTQLVFCDLSVPNTARKSAATKPQRVYVREPDGGLIHASGTAHTVAGAEELPFLLVARKRQGRTSVAVYDAATGRLRHEGAANRDAALAWAQDVLRDPARRERWQAARETEREAGQELTQAEIDDYNDANAIDTETVEGLSLQDIVGLSAAENFSVYDDLRAKLVRAGVPAHEIAFIHDYPNAEAKDKLFKRVKSGEVRFLFGSTAKMGAGTNVQDRIVGLHHIDAPWKPSDLEQREGRAIRRGNLLYARDPDGFEVAIYRYATRQTYDTRRWQLLEHKARGIAQLRKYDGVQTEIEDIDGEAANAAEMKAAASGDPLILRETQLRNDVRRLEQLELAHADNQAALQRQARSSMQYAETTGPRRVKALQAFAAAAKLHAMPKDKEAVPGGTTLDGERFTERKALTQALARRVGALLGPSERAAPVAFVYRGVTFDIERIGAHRVGIVCELGEATSYERGGETFSATGLLTRLNNVIDRVEAEVVETQARIASAREEAERFKAEAAKPFDQVQALQEARDQYRRVQRLLLVRGPEIPPTERPLLDAALEAQRSALREVGLGDALDELLDYKQQNEDGVFSRRKDAAGRGASVAQVRRAVDELVAGWRGAPVIRVVATPRDLPASARRAPDAHLADGFYQRSTGTVYLVASNLPTRQAVERVLMHEAVGHFGLEAIVGPALWAQVVDGVHRLRERGQYRALFAEHAQRGYLDNGWDDTAVREFVAMMAEHGVKDTLLDRIVAAVRAFLRKLGVRWALGEAELRQLIVRAARRVRLGGDAVRTAATGDAYGAAFSRVEGFRSALVQALERAEGAPRRGTAVQWRQWLDGVQRRGGFKQAERDWLRVDDWLGQRERVTREDLADYVRTHQVRVGEELIGGDVDRFHAALARLQAAGFEIESDDYFGVGLLRDGESVDPETLTDSQRADLDALEAGMEAEAPLVAGSTRYASLQTEGGRDYRELLLTLPTLVSNRESGRPYRSEHYPAVKNLLAHVRFNTREDVNGKRMLFIEELQSDWHQEGRKHGYLPAEGADVPDAPFKKTEEWTQLAFKRMVRWAVEHGYQRIGWTTGQQQIDRYAQLTEAVDAIDYTPIGDGRYRVVGLKRGEDQVSRELDSAGLVDFLGSAVAERIRNGEGKESPRSSMRGPATRRLDGLALRVGGEGMRGYYDRILPAVVNRWARPLGAETATAQIRPRFRHPATTVHALDITPAMRAVVAEGLPLFSKRAPEDFLADVDAVVRSDEDASRLDRVRQWLRDSTPAKLKDATRKTWLGALATNQLTELGSDYDPAVAGFSRLLDAMSADRNALLEQGAELAESVRRWAGKHREEAKRLFDLMHRATLEGVDPAEAYKMLQFRYGGQLRDATRPNIREALKALREQMLGRGGDSKVDMMEEVRRLRGMPKREDARKRVYPTLRAAWEALTPEAQGFYRQMRDLYRERSEQAEDALAERIEASEAPEPLQRKLIHAIRQQFEAHRLQGVYFPLQRYGEYFIAAERGDEPVFLMLDSLSELERKEAAFKARGFTIRARGRLRSAQAKDAPSGSFVVDVIEKLRKAGVSEKTQDAVYQTYLQALPELSMRKHAIHRKGVAGFDPDALRAFAHNMAHGAHQLARLRYGHQLEHTLAALRATQDLRRQSPDADTRAVVAMDAILGELDQRHQWVLNPQDSALTHRLSSVGFVYFLGATPAAALVNLTQTAMLTFPQLAAQYGPGKAMRALLQGMNESARTLGHAQKALARPDERKAHEALQRAGVLDKTQTHALMGLAEGGLATYSPKLARTMELIGWLFHKAEVLNREASGMAAYRLARDAGAPFEAAVRAAADTIAATHFNYGNANRARFLQAGPAKVVLMFKQYGLNMLWHLGRMGWKATRGETPEVRRLARRNLAGVLAMSGVFSGAMGLPMASLAIGVVDAIAHAFGDEDDPWDTEAELRKFFAQFLGDAGAQIAMHGAANALTGADIASRVELSQLLWRDADRELDGRDAYYAMMDNIAGPMFGIAKNFFVGTQLVAEGQVYRGVETMLPKALKDAMKAVRYAREDATTTRGDLVADTDLQDELLQALGFTPADVAEQYAENRALKDRERLILDRRKALLAGYAMALRQGDQEAAAELRRKISAFNKAYPEKPITGQAIQRSLQSRQAYTARAEHGVVIDRALQSRISEEEGMRL